MITLNAIEQRLRQFAENHFFIHSYGFGSPDEVDLDKYTAFPLLYVVYTGATYDDNKAYSFEVYVLDRPTEQEAKSENRREVVSDSEQCLEDLVADITTGFNIFQWDEAYNVEAASVSPIVDARTNVLSGALLDLTISVPYQYESCNLPIDGVQPQGGEISYARRGLLRILTQDGTTDVPSVNTIKVTNGTLTDDGNGVVSLSITGGAGGAVDSVNGETGYVVLDTDDIDEGTTNLYYTNDRVDARITAAGLATVAYVDAEVGAEESARITADSGLQTQINAAAAGVSTNAGDIDQLETDLAAETAARIAADSTLQSGIDTNAGAITTEAGLRAAADSNLQSQISSNDGDITALDGRLTTAEGEIDALQAATHVNTLNGLSGAVTLSPGSNVTLTQVGNDIEISSSGGGGGGSDSFSTIAVPGQSSIVADHGNDTLNINAGTGVVLTTDAGTDTLTIGTTISVNGEPADASGDIAVTTTEVPEGSNLYYTEARVSANVNVAANTAKLATIATGAEVNVNADWNATSGDAEILNKPTIPDDISQLGGSTDDLDEGQTNKYYTDTRVQTYLTAEKIRANYPTETIGGTTILTAAQEQKFLVCNSSSAITLTVPTGLAADAEILAYQAGTGTVTVAAGSGVTLRNTSNFANSTAEQYAIIGLKQLGTSNVWVVTGERTAL